MATGVLGATFAIAVVAAVGSGPAAAEEAPEGFRWNAPVGCPDADAVRLQLQDLLETSDVGLDEVGVDGRMTLADSGYALELRVAVSGTVESRSVESDDCALLSRTAALLVAITVDAVAAAQAIEHAEAAPEQPPIDDDPVVPPSPETREVSVAVQNEPAPAPAVTVVEARRPRAKPWRHGIEGGVGGGLGVALVPGVTGGIEAMIGWRYGPVRVRALGYHWFSRPTQLQPGAGAEAALSGGGLRACYAAAWPRIEVPVCAGPDVAALHGAGIGDAVDPQPYRDVWIALAAGTGIEVKLSPRFSFVARAEALVGLRRPALHLQAGDTQLEVFRTPPAGFRLVLGVSVHSR